jgi:hypothetical protein
VKICFLFLEYQMLLSLSLSLNNMELWFKTSGEEALFSEAYVQEQSSTDNSPDMSSINLHIGHSFETCIERNYLSPLCTVRRHTQKDLGTKNIKL